METYSEQNFSNPFIFKSIAKVANIVSVFHQKLGGIGKFILSALKISLGKSLGRQEWISQYLPTIYPTSKGNANRAILYDKTIWLPMTRVLWSWYGGYCREERQGSSLNIITIPLLGTLHLLPFINILFPHNMIIYVSSPSQNFLTRKLPLSGSIFVERKSNPPVQFNREGATQNFLLWLFPKQRTSPTHPMDDDFPEIYRNFSPKYT